MSPSDAFSELAQEALTDDQRDVVRDLGHGPIKVVAAAGSGKTTTMAWLYAAALVDQVPQGQIIAVTFTERAAAELRRKVLEVMVQARLAPAGSTAQQLDGAWIGTFHQLVRRLLGERAYLAGLPRDLELLDEVEAGMVMEEAVAQVRQQTAAASWLGHLPLDPDPRTVLNLVAGARSTVYRLRSTELTPGRCAALSEEAYAEAEALGDPVEQIAWHRAALRLTLALWEEYERRLLQRHAVDFDGLLREGLLALRRSPRLLGWCRANFRLVIVDEYQDTSALQESLIHELTGPDHRTLFTVGDARQSIYAFRDAKPGIMAEAPGRTRELFLNRRSRVDILAAADHLIKGDPDFADDQPMVAHRKVEPSLPVFYAEVEDPVREAEAIAAALEQLHRDGITYPDSSHQPVSWRDMAILAYTQSRVGAPLEEALRRRGIPFQTATGGLLDRPEVRDLLSFVRLAGDDRDDLACLRLLQSPVGRVPDQALAQLSAPGRRTGRTLAERVRAHLAAGAPGWDRAWADRTALLLGVVERLRLAAGTARAGELVSRALAESGLLQLEEARARSGAPGGRRALASLRELQRIVWGVESPHRWLTLAGLLARLELMQAGARTAEPPPETDEDLVTLSTIHRAKGLEWPVVVLADCRPFHRQGGDAVLWDRRAQAVICTRLAAGQKTAARTRWGESPDAKVDRDERRRLVYVAMTRARDLLLVTTTRAGEDGEFARLAGAAQPWVREWPRFGEDPILPWSAPGALALPLTEPGADTQPRGVSGARLVQRWSELKRLPVWSGTAPQPPEQLSFTSLEVLDRCPRQFWYRYLARYPSPQPGPEPARPPLAGALPEPLGRGRALDLGVAVHQVLERIHSRSPDRTPSPVAARAELESLADDLDGEQFASAQAMIDAYLGGPAAALPTEAVEFAFSWAGWGGAEDPPLVGVIDRIARRPGGELVIIDYKTNLALGPGDLETYSRQLQLYAAALAAGVMGSPVADPKSALALLRTGELIAVPCGVEERRTALKWAARAAAQLRSGNFRSDMDHPDRPCPGCAYLERCPERRQEVPLPQLMGV